MSGKDLRIIVLVIAGYLVAFAACGWLIVTNA